MKLSRFLSIAASVTFFSLLYVYQQTEILCFAYTAQNMSTVFQDSLDRNTVLRYNINARTSLVRLDNEISRYGNFQMPESYRLVRLARPQKALKLTSKERTLTPKNIVSVLFGVKRQAEARTINP